MGNLSRDGEMRLLLAIVVGLPLLMPPSVCICQHPPCASSTPAESRTSKVAQENAEEPAKCTCCRHRVNNDSVAAQVEGKFVGTTTVKHDPACPCQHKHAPGCPIVKSTDKLWTGETPLDSISQFT